MHKLRQNCAGFSLIEVIIVLAIVGIIATFSISNLYAVGAHGRLERGELQVSSILKEARSLAISEECNTRVVFSEIDGTMVTERQDPDTSSWSQVGATANLTEGVNFAVGSITLPSSAATFTARGTLLAGGSLTIENTDGESTTFTGNVVSGRFPLSGGNLR